MAGDEGGEIMGSRGDTVMATGACEEGAQEEGEEGGAKEGEAREGQNVRGGAVQGRETGRRRPETQLLVVGRSS
eukprot:1110267-Prorocentrum_minimum.AAC.1